MSAQRFEAATAAARNLPGDLLSQAQKLKLYALYKQIEQGPAPAAAPAGLSALARDAVDLAVPDESEDDAARRRARETRAVERLQVRWMLTSFLHISVLSRLFEFKYPQVIGQIASAR